MLDILENHNLASLKNMLLEQLCRNLNWLDDIIVSDLLSLNTDKKPLKFLRIIEQLAISAQVFVQFYFIHSTGLDFSQFRKQIAWIIHSTDVLVSAWIQLDQLISLDYGICSFIFERIHQNVRGKWHANREEQIFFAWTSEELVFAY